MPATYEVTLTVPVTVDCRTGQATVFSEISQFFTEDGYRDGRYPFSKELLAQALTDVFRQCVYRSVTCFFERTHGRNTMMRLDDRTEINRAVYEAEKWMTEHLKRITVSMEDWKASAFEIK